MKRYGVKILLIGLLLSCQSKSDNANFKLKKSLKSEATTSIDSISTKESIQKFVDGLSNNYTEIEDNRKAHSIRLKKEILSEANNLLKYQFQSNDLILNKYNQKSYQRPEITILQFQNTSKCNKAKELLMNCFPNDCQKIEFDVSKSIKITPSIYLLSDMEIMIMKINCENEDGSWNKLKTKFKRFAMENTKIIEAECGRIKWTK